MKFITTHRTIPRTAVRITLTADKVVREVSGELRIGCGERKDMTRRKLLKLLRRIIVEAKQRHITTLGIEIDAISFPKLKIQPRELGELVAVNFSLADFEYETYKTKKDELKPQIGEVYLIGATAAMRQGIKRGELIADEINQARVLANTPGGAMTPRLLARAAERAAQNTKIRVSILEVVDMKKFKMGALLGVAQGSKEPPRFIIMEYRGASKKIKPVVLVGKGVTFDSGGINLKPSASMEHMHMDMSGAAMVMHACVAAAKLKLKNNIIALIPAVENMVSGSSYRPGDILKSMSGTTIEIGNTDAEGRVILADALTFAAKYSPRAVIDVATLTGASLVALGQRAMAIFSNNRRLTSLAQTLGEEVGEYVWGLPLWDEYNEDIKAIFGDISNTGKTKYGGTITAAQFLHHFAKEYQWLHIDMAPRMTSIEGDYLEKGSTGEPIRLLVRLLQKI